MSKQLPKELVPILDKTIARYDTIMKVTLDEGRRNRKIPREVQRGKILSLFLQGIKEAYELEK